MRKLPRYLWLVLAVLCVQVLLNVFGASVLLFAINADHNTAVPESGLLYFVVYFSLLASAVLAVSALFLVLRNTWARYPVIGIEAIGMVSGLISLLAVGTPAGITNLALGFAVISMLVRPEIRDWLAGGNIQLAA